MLSRLLLALLLLPAGVSISRAADYSAETFDAAPPKEVSEKISALLSHQAVRIKRGSRAAMEIWLMKSWKVSTDFKPTSEVLYPFSEGQLIGVIRYVKRGGDFRDQTIGRGVYTLRYGQQPVDGNHEGTSPTRDFLLLVQAEVDESLAPFDPMKLSELSAEAAGSGHPAMLCLQSRHEPPKTVPAMLHDEDQEWWLLRHRGKVNAGGKVIDLPFDLVVVGYSE